MLYKILAEMKKKIDFNDLPSSDIGKKKFKLVEESICLTSVNKFDEAQKKLTEATKIDASGNIDTYSQKLQNSLVFFRFLFYTRILKKEIY